MYQGPKVGETLIAQMTAWDTEDDAREFVDAYVKRSLLRYPNARQMPLKSAELLQWSTSEGDVRIEGRGTRVLIVEGVPATTSVNKLFRLLWQD
ncbi:MAG: hypothetical protein ABR555_16935 [Pyrinomonadaceae bacterium]